MTPTATPGLQKLLPLPLQWLGMYDDLIAKNASQVSQIETALRSLTYLVPGRLRDAEMASEMIHSGVQLLSLYHDTVLSGQDRPPDSSRNPNPKRRHSAHARYTYFWMARSPLYRRAALVLQTTTCTQLLLEMVAKRRGDGARWRLVVLVESVKAMSRLAMLRVTRRTLVTPPLPLRPASEADDVANQSGWAMPRSGLHLPSPPAAGATSAYLASRALTADDIKLAPHLLPPLAAAHPALAVELLRIFVPLLYASALATSAAFLARTPRGAARTRAATKWAPWVLGLMLDLAARYLRQRSASLGGLASTALERDEWARRSCASLWWTLRGHFYHAVARRWVEACRRRMPRLVAALVEDYACLWAKYYFSTSP